MKNEIFAAILVSSLCLLSVEASSPESTGDWRKDRDQAGRLELTDNFAGAVALYERGLKKLPVDALSERVDFECQIAINYLRLNKDVQAEAAIEAMLVNFKKLRSAKTLSADTEMSVHSLIEEIDGGSGPKQTLEQWHKHNLLALRIASEILPNLINYSRVSKVTRGYLGRSKPALALEYVNFYVARMPKTALKYGDVLLNAAALKAFLGDSSSLDAISLQMRKTQSASVVAARVAEAQTWATDYSGAEKTVERCLQELIRKKCLTQADEVRLNLARLGNYADHGEAVKGEKLARRFLAYKLDDETRRQYLEWLALCLAEQGKTKESAMYEAQGRKFGFVVDDERAATAERERRHAAQH